MRVLQRPRRAPWKTTLWPAQLASWLIGGPDIGEHKQHGREKKLEVNSVSTQTKKVRLVKKRDISEPESESETSEYEDGGSPSSQNTVLHKRKPRDDQRRSKFRHSREDTLLDVTCMNIRTSTPQESLVNTSEK